MIPKIDHQAIFAVSLTKLGEPGMTILESKKKGNPFLICTTMINELGATKMKRENLLIIATLGAPGTS